MRDDDAIDDALREILPRLRRFARRLTRDASSADDLVQSTFERALSRWDTRRDDTALRAWLCAIAYRLFLDDRRRARRRAAVLELLGRGAKAEHPSLERGAAARSVIQALDRLPEAQRHLFALGVRGGPELPRGGRASWRARRHRDVAIVACPRATSAGEGSFNLHRQSLHPTQCGQVRVDVDQPAGRH